MSASAATNTRIVVLGAGSMGGAVLQGLVAHGYTDLVATNRSAAKAEAIATDGVVDAIALEREPEGNLRAVRGADVVLVGVKPGMVVDLLKEIAPELEAGALVVSLAAGVTNATMEQALGGTRKVVRAMPNTPALIGEGVTGLAGNTHTTEADLARLKELFTAVGPVIITDEDGIDKLSTISGSGPAYVFFLMEALTDAAEVKGFSTEDARLMVEQTFLGAAQLLRSSGETPTELRRRVTSPKGTTERAVAVMADADLPGLFARATDAALARAKELAAGE